MSLIEAFHVSPTLFYSCMTVFGLLVGSFLNVVIYRLPKMLENQWRSECKVLLESETPALADIPEPEAPFNLVKPDSHCPNCGHKIRPWENIPLLSYALQKGKCVSCGAAIPWHYPMVELAGGVAALSVALVFGPTPQTLAALALTFVLLALLAIDMRTMLLPDQLTLPLLWLGLLLSLDNVFVSPQEAILGAALGYLVLWGIYWAFKLLTGKEGMGYGDFKLLAALGAFVGWQGLPLIVFFSSLVGALLGGLQIALSKRGRGQPMPFGPYLAIAGWLTLLFGADVWAWYIGLVT